MRSPSRELSERRARPLSVRQTKETLPWFTKMPSAGHGRNAYARARVLRNTAEAACPARCAPLE